MANGHKQARHGVGVSIENASWDGLTLSAKGRAEEGLPAKLQNLMNQGLRRRK